jgi:hypothetical protein
MERFVQQLKVVAWDYSPKSQLEREWDSIDSRTQLHLGQISRLFRLIGAIVLAVFSHPRKQYGALPGDFEPSVWDSIHRHGAANFHKRHEAFKSHLESTSRPTTDAEYLTVYSEKEYWAAAFFFLNIFHERELEHMPLAFFDIHQVVLDLDAFLPDIVHLKERAPAIYNGIWDRCRDLDAYMAASRRFWTPEDSRS